MTGSQPKILILDSDQKGREKLARRLIPKGCEVETIGTLAGAVELMRNVCFDYIIADVNLPKVDSDELLSVLESMSPGARLIATARHNSLELESKVRRHNIVFYYLKNSDSQELELLIDTLLQKARHK